MSDSQDKPWSDNPNAPQIPYYLYFEEKADFAGVLIGSILYGMHGATPDHTPMEPSSLCLLGFSRDPRRALLPVYGRAA